MPLGIVVARGLDECRAEVVPLDLDVVEELGRDGLAGAELGRLGERDVVVEMAITRRRLLAGLTKLHGRELADRLEHPEAGLASGRLVGDEARVEQRLQRRRHVRARVGDSLDRVEGRATGEDGERAEDVRGRVVEEAVAPVDRRAQRALPLGEVRCAPRQQREALSEPLRGALGAEHPHPRGRELDREREPVERPADPRDCVRVRVGELEVG